MTKRIWAMVLCLCLWLTAVPYGILAEGATTGTVYGLSDGTPLNLSDKDQKWEVLANTFKF